MAFFSKFIPLTELVTRIETLVNIDSIVKIVKLGDNTQLDLTTGFSIVVKEDYDTVVGGIEHRLRSN
jgi:uncharacterized protein YlzI (FlbEa/FlbD family)